MPKTDARVDALIAHAQPFAQPVLAELRKRVHKAVPEVEETIKWGMPFFLCDGKILATMAAFKQHARFGVWGGKGPRFTHLTSVKDLPSPAVFVKQLKQAVKRLGTDEAEPAPAPAKGPVVVPQELLSALRKNARARAAFAKLPPGYRREYAEWIAEAKGADTRTQRVVSAVDWIAQGKSRHWKYQR